MLYALVHRTTQVTVIEEDENKRALLTYCAKDITNNLQVVDSTDMIMDTVAAIPVLTL